MASLKKHLKDKGFVLVQMKRTSTDHFEVEAVLNGVPGRFIVDTGASNTCVAVEHADRFGLISEEAEVKAAGAGNAEMEAWISPENSLKLGKWKKKIVPIVLFDLSHVNHALTSRESTAVDGIIGADILKEGKAVIDYRKKRLYLKK